MFFAGDRLSALPPLNITGEFSTLMPRRLFLALILPLSLTTGALAQLRVATWNVTNFSTATNTQGVTAAQRAGYFSTSIYGSFQGRSFAPDVLLTQEILGASAASSFLGILNAAPGSPGDWAMAPFVNNTNSTSESANNGSNAFFYRASKIELFGQATIANAPRQTMRYDVRFRGYRDMADAPTLSLYSDHLKSGAASADVTTRAAETANIRANAASLPVGRAFLLGGDFNTQNSSEADYQNLVGAGTNGASRFYDPINSPGAWNNNANFRFIHTQDPVGSGGMDDRHDQILISNALKDGAGLEYIGDTTKAYSTTTWNDPNHSYRAWGNDGTSFNTHLTTTGNGMVGPEIAQALRNSVGTADRADLTGGHLPVFLDLRTAGELYSTTTVLDFGDVALGSMSSRAFDLLNGVDVSLYGVGGIQTLNYTLTADGGFAAPSGSFLEAPGAGANTHLVTLDTSVAGLRTGTLTIADVSGATRTISLRANVQAVPEPATLAALGLGAAAMLRRRKRV